MRESKQNKWESERMSWKMAHKGAREVLRHERLRAELSSLFFFTQEYSVRQPLKFFHAFAVSDLTLSFFGYRYFELDPEGMTPASRMAMENNNEGLRRMISNNSQSGRYSS